MNSGCKIIAVDIDHENLQTLTRHLRSRNADTVIPVQYDGTHLPVATNSIDFVVSYEVIEHVDDETVVLREIQRVLKPHGEIVLSVPNKGWIFETHGASLPLFRWNRVPFFSWLPHWIHRRFAHARIYRKRDVVKLLSNNLFEVLSTEYITAPLDVVKNLRIKRFLRASLFRQDTTRLTCFSTAILVHCRKK